MNYILMSLLNLCKIILLGVFSLSPIINGTKIPEYLLGSLHETILNQSEAIDLRNALEKDGYLFLRNVIGKDEIAKAREDIFQKLG